MTIQEAIDELRERMIELPSNATDFNRGYAEAIRDLKQMAEDESNAMTKAEYIRGLSDDDLAKFIRNISLSGCAVCAYVEHCSHDGVEEDFCLLGVEQWLKQEHKSNSFN